MESRTKICSTAESISNLAPFIHLKGNQINLFWLFHFSKGGIGRGSRAAAVTIFMHIDKQSRFN